MPRPGGMRAILTTRAVTAAACLAEPTETEAADTWAGSLCRMVDQDELAEVECAPASNDGWFAPVLELAFRACARWR